MSENKEVKMNTFSVIIPCCGRYLVKRAIESVQRQIYDGEIEIIIVDDSRSGSNKEPFARMLDEIAKKDKRIKIIHHDIEKQRVVSRNDGMKVATKDWICWLDDDDEYVRTYIYTMNYHINKNPEYPIFYFGAIVHKAERSWIRECPEIKEGGPNREVMETFWSGTIGTGSFIFKRELLDDVGYLPEGDNSTPYAFADAMKRLRPEIYERYGGFYMDGGKEFGNPWSDDWAMIYLLTRKYKAKGIPVIPYIQYVRRGGYDFQDNNLNID